MLAPELEIEIGFIVLWIIFANIFIINYILIKIKGDLNKDMDNYEDKLNIYIESLKDIRDDHEHFNAKIEALLDRVGVDKKD